MLKAHEDALVSRVDVSFVLPCLDEAGTLPWCIDRAQQAITFLENTYGLKGEIIVADNGSQDGSPQIAKNLGARVVSIDRRGYGATLRGVWRRLKVSTWSWATATALMTSSRQYPWS